MLLIGKSVEVIVFMAMQRYEISLQVLKIIFQHDSEIWYLQSGYVMFFLLYKHQWNTKPFHFNVLLLWKADLLCNY